MLATAAIVGGSKILSGIFGGSAKKKQAKQQRKIAKENYNLLMENAGFLQKQVGENVDLFKRQADTFRSSQLQKYGLSGIRADLSGVKETASYGLGVDEIDYEGNEAETETRRVWRWGSREGEENYREVEVLKKAGAEVDTDLLKRELANYEGRSAEFETQAQDSMLLNLQKSTENLQSDLNKVYQQGMTSVYQERRKAENALKTGQMQAAATSAAGTADMWSGLFSGLTQGYLTYKEF